MTLAFSGSEKMCRNRKQGKENSFAYGCWKWTCWV